MPRLDFAKSSAMGARDMFTGLIQDIGTLQSLRHGAMIRLGIAGLRGERLTLGESISCNGICLLPLLLTFPLPLDVVSRKHCIRQSS